MPDYHDMRDKPAPADTPLEAEPPPLVLADEPLAEVSPPPVNWRRALLMMLVAAALVFATATAVNARRDAQAEQAAAGEAHLVVGEVNGGMRHVSLDDAIDFHIDVYNAGDRAVTILSLEFPGWESITPTQAQPIQVKPDAWIVAQARAHPDCETQPQSLNAVVQTDAGERSVKLRLPSDQTTARMLSYACSTGTLEVWLSNLMVEEVERTGDAIVFHTVIDAMGNGRGGELGATLVGVAADVPGYAVELAVSVELSEGENPLTMVWRIDDCAKATRFTHGVIEYESEANVPVYGDGRLPVAMTAELARFATETCDGHAG